MVNKNLITYRPEIDGLRAIAVGAVILYHAQITLFGHQPFKGGFIGVDIFFVISGYLITSIILKELVTTGTFSFKYFYERRVRRILPALLFVMLVSLPFAWMYLLPYSLVDFSKSILYSLGFSSNFYFDFTGQLYGAKSGFLKPFLHTWSLSVEEQYYILFPIVFLFCFKHFRKHIGIILVIGFLISLLGADWGSKNRPYFAFYALPTRSWELIAGSILAYFEIQLGHRSKNQTLNLILPSVGLLLIGHSILFFNDKMFHPSFYTLSPIIGVCLIIWFSHKNELITKILSLKLFVGIGLISYSLYLWHYTIFAFARISEFTQDNMFKEVLLGFIILLLSLISYYLIERPARNKQYQFKFIISFIITFLTLLILTNLFIVKQDGYKKRLPKIFQNSETVDSISGLGFFGELKNSNKENCHININGCKFNTSYNKRVYIIGDSHMGSLMFNLKDRITNKDYQFITSTFGGCIYFPKFNRINIKNSKINEYCNNDYFLKLEKTLKKHQNSIIIFGGRLPLYLNNYLFNNKEGGVEKGVWNEKFVSTGKYNTIQSSFKNSIDELSKNNQIILIYPIPEVGLDVPQIILNQYPKNFYSTKKVELKDITTSYQVYKERTQSSFELLNSIKGENIYRVFPHQLFCNTLIKDRCITHNNKNIFYYDDNHPSYFGSKMINDLIIKEIEKIEAKSN